MLPNVRWLNINGTLSGEKVEFFHLTFETSAVMDLVGDEIDVPNDESSVLGARRQLLAIVGKPGEPNLIAVFGQRLRRRTCGRQIKKIHQLRLHRQEEEKEEDFYPKEEEEEKEEEAE